MPTPDPAAITRSLSKDYPGGVHALRGIDLEIPRGRITALLGANGSGKTTLIRILAGRARASAGDVRVLGCDPADHAARFKARIGYVGQDVALDPEMRIDETMRLFALLHGLPRREQQARIDELVDAFGLHDHAKARTSSLSGGLKRRLHVALGMLHRPEILLLDEPTSGLDPAGRAHLWRALARICEQGASVVVVAHDLDDVEAHCHHVVILERGAVIAGAPPERIRADHASARLVLRLDQSVVDSEGFAGVLVALEGVARVRFDGPELTVESSLDRPPVEAILAALVERRVGVGSFEVLPANLASAYFHLTGHAAPASSPAQALHERGAGSGSGRARGHGART